MGRIARKGFEYYRAETDRFRDIKIRKLRKEHSCAGYAIYQYVLNEIYRVEGCYIRFTDDQMFDVSEYWGIEEERRFSGSSTIVRKRGCSMPESGNSTAF